SLMDTLNSPRDERFVFSRERAGFSRRLETQSRTQFRSLGRCTSNKATRRKNSDRVGRIKAAGKTGPEDA
ncbi:hypothetical protein K0M31_013707, partial [Melipona bicolor]